MRQHVLWVQISHELKVGAPEPRLKQAGAEAAAMEADFLASLHETRLWEARLQDARDQVGPVFMQLASSVRLLSPGPCCCAGSLLHAIQAEAEAEHSMSQQDDTAHWQTGCDGAEIVCCTKPAALTLARVALA